MPEALYFSFYLLGSHRKNTKVPGLTTISE